jgi:small subunit ribosomal protein S21
MIRVWVVNGDLEGAVKVYYKKVTNDGIYRELRDRRYFRSKTQKRKIKDQRSQERQRKAYRRRMKSLRGKGLMVTRKN